MRDVWSTRIVRRIVTVLIVIGVLALLFFALPIMAGIYMMLFVTSWNLSVVELFNLPLMNLGQANALCLVSALVLVPLIFLMGLVRIVTK